ncbi:MAG: cytochrome b/b6 domain-containing protein [Methyloceanibacter sp.]|uniref:cytochrome b/b6 domain-containing protein n=1 Tax=Methyloceanibacter sp. TaxID=1965321 RepID=UPI003D6C7143
MPGGRGFSAAVRAYVASFLTGEPEQYVGHNPLARMGVTLLLLLLLIQVITGLVLAGTDLYWPPFGSLFAQWVAAPGVDPGTLQPGASDLADKLAYQAMRNFRGPFVEVHEITFYVLAAAIIGHIGAVVITELREGGSITSCSQVTKFSAGSHQTHRRTLEGQPYATCPWGESSRRTDRVGPKAEVTLAIRHVRLVPDAEDADY